ncbi:MAG: ATP-binding protein, partial [Succinivibrio sp.]
VDVGVVDKFETNSQGKRIKKNLEIDFIASLGIHKHCIQSAHAMSDEDKQRVELRPLLLIDDSFRKVVVSRSYGKSWIDDKGILRLGLMDFLLNENSLDS